MNMKTILIFLLSLLSFITQAQTFNAPESVVYDEINNRYLVSNAGTGMSGGSIVAVDRNTLTTSTFISSGVSSPKGMIILNDYLYFTDVTSIKKADLTTAVVVATYPISGAVFCNDLLHVNGLLYISDSQAHRIYKYNLATEILESVIDPPIIQNPNGLAFDTLNNRIVFVSYRPNSPVQGISLHNDSVFLIASTPIGNLDGVAFDKQGNIYISSWSTNSIYTSDGSCCDPFHEFATGFAGPADFIIATNDTMVIPNFLNNNVVYYKITAGIKNSDKSGEITIYPNPSKDIFNFKNCGTSRRVTITVFNRWGQELYKSENINFNTDDTLQVDLSKFPSGTYYYSLKQGEQILRTGHLIKI
jgi:hypothetical protein